MATHSSILASKTPWTEKPGGLQCKGLQRVGQDEPTWEHIYICVRVYSICMQIIFDFKYTKQWNDIQTHTKLSIIIAPNGVSKASLHGKYIVARLIHVYPFIHLLLNFETCESLS